MEPGVAGPLLGRDQELHDSRPSSTTSGGGSPAVVVTGEPGIGKTRLLDELA